MAEMIEASKNEDFNKLKSSDLSSHFVFNDRPSQCDYRT